MSQRINLSLKELLGSSYTDYITNAVLPEIQRLAKQGKITPFELRKVRELIQRKGIDVLSPQLRVLNEVTLNSAANDGCIFEAELPLTSEVSIRHVIKQSSQREDYDKAVKLQENVRRALRSTEYEHVIPSQVYTNPKQRIIITPFVEGTTLKDRFRTEAPKQREQTLREVIDQYIPVFRQLNQQDTQSQLELPAQLQDFNTFFVRTYLDGKTEGHETLVDAFKTNIGDSLNAARRYVAHGDFHPGNILINGNQTYIDWPKATSNGFPEFDLATVIRKSDLDPDLEERVITYATEKLTDEQDKQRQSRELLTKELIKRDLIASKRYSQAAEKTESEEVKTRMHEMSVVAYNSAVRRIKRAQEQGIVHSNLLEAIIQNPPKETICFVDDTNYNLLRERSNPYCAMTQEHMEPKKPLTDIIQGSLDDEIKDLRRTVKWQSTKRFLRNIGIGILGLGALVAGTFGLLKYGEIKQEETRTELSYEDSKSSTLRLYQAIFRDAFEKFKVGIIDGKIQTRLPIDSPEIDAIAQEYHLDPRLLRDIMRVNRVYAEIDISINPQFRKLEDLNLLDPITAVEEKVVEPLANLRKGAKRLSELVKESKGDVEQAVYRFYDPARSESCYPQPEKKCFKWRYGDIDGFEVSGIKEDQVKLAYNALNGMGTAMDGGIWSLYFQSPRKVDPPKGTSREDCEQKCDYSYQGQLFVMNDGKFCVERCTPPKQQTQKEKDCLERCKEYPQAGPIGGACEIGCGNF